MDELDRFFEEDPIRLDLCPDPLAWWLSDHSTFNFSILRKLATSL